MILICFQAPTWIFVRLQPPEHKLCFFKAPTLDIGAPTPRTPIIPVLRHQPQGLQPSTANCLDLFCQGTNFGYRSTNSKDTNPSNFWGTNPKGSDPLVKACLIVMFCSQNSSLLNSVCLQLHCSLHATASTATSLHMKKSLQLFILSTQSLQKLSHDDIK